MTVQYGKQISIHALRMEGDLKLLSGCKIYFYFNPRPPHGGRLIRPIVRKVALVISIHALRMEGD